MSLFGTRSPSSRDQPFSDRASAFWGHHRLLVEQLAGVQGQRQLGLERRDAPVGGRQFVGLHARDALKPTTNTDEACTDEACDLPMITRPSTLTTMDLQHGYRSDGPTIGDWSQSSQSEEKALYEIAETLKGYTKQHSGIWT